MRRAVFFPGQGTVYSGANENQDGLEFYPETLPAFRFLARRGFDLILVTPDYQELRLIRAALKDKKLLLYHWNTSRMDFSAFLEKYRISEEESYFITDGLYLKHFMNKTCKIILVLSGRGFDTLTSVPDPGGFADICKNIYAAAFSVTMNKL